MSQPSGTNQTFATNIAEALALGLKAENAQTNEAAVIGALLLFLTIWRA